VNRFCVVAAEPGMRKVAHEKVDMVIPYALNAV
jgi:hypothetical protein